MGRITTGASKPPYTDDSFQGHPYLQGMDFRRGEGGTSLACFPPSKKDPRNFLGFFYVRLQDDGGKLNRTGVYFGEHQHLDLDIQLRFCKRGSISGV